MSASIDIRDSTADDLPAIVALYRDAFPDEDLVPLVRGLLDGTPEVRSFVAMDDGELVGHVTFTICTADDKDVPLALLAPLAVATRRHRQGIGSALVAHGFARLRADGVAHAYTLGDPNYYGRFGFRAERDVQPPYPMPEEWREAWQSVGLRDDAPAAAGLLDVPPAWRDPALWGP